MGVRPIESSDWDVIHELRAMFPAEGRRSCESEKTMLVWDDGAAVNGFISYSYGQRNDGRAENPAPFIEQCVVREGARMRGVARALVLAVEEAVRTHGSRELWSYAVPSDAVSVAVHRQLGFRPSTRFQLFRKDVRTNAVAFVIKAFAGARSDLLPLFAQADDSLAEIGTYLEAGGVLVAVRGELIVGHVQTIAGGGNWEIKSIAVVESEQGCGIGTALIRAALNAAWSSGAGRVLVATATADIENLRFYQRLGFRMDRVERDAFSIMRGYRSLEVNGIPLRDRAWLSIEAPR